MIGTQPLSPKRIGVIVGKDLIGDALIKLPFVRALRAAFPEARILWITSQGPTALGSALRDITRSLIDEIHEVPVWLPQDSTTRHTAPTFDLLIDTRGKWRQALAVRPLARGGVFITPALRYLFSDRRPQLFARRPQRMIARLMQMLALATGPLPPSTERIPIPDIFLEKARRLLPEGQIYVGLAPGAGNSIKAWPRERFIAVAQKQTELGRTPVFLLGPDEESWRSALSAAVPTALFPLQERALWGTEKIALSETLAVGTCLNVAVANDSGTSHMLAAVDCPLISLFGPTSANKLAPFVTRGLVVCAQDFGGTEMDLITTESVVSAINEVISLR